MEMFVNGRWVPCEGKVVITQTNPLPVWTDSLKPADLKEVSGSIKAEFEDRDTYERLMELGPPAELTLIRQYLTVRRRLARLRFLIARPRGRSLLGVRCMSMVITLPQVQFAPLDDAERGR